ncbi:TonB-dependent receptor, partial [Dialister sp.]|uniref:TonB-dependent receptor n=1 Tax=Dialister sp. TaxID=1955814 RepID=UPI003F0579ED
MTSKSRKTAVLLALLALAGAGTAGAETPVYTLKGITVTANRQAERLQDVPANVQVVTEKDIQKRNVQNAAQAVAMATGVSASQSVEGTVNLRGYSSKNVLVLVDGQPMNTAWNGDVDWNMIPVENIRKIEVVSGGQSALYGGRAVGGVINIMTKTQKQDGVHGSATVSYGSNATVNQG